MDFTESKAVVKIFEEYLNGSSLLQISKLMESEKVRYSECSDRWNKNMVKRIIENEKYLGTKKYPRIISEKFFIQTNEKRASKATSICSISDELQEIRNRTYCTECGHRLSRFGGNTHTDKWDCRNPECSRFNYRLTDNMIKDILLHILNAVIANPDLLDTDSEISGYTPNIKVKCQQNELNRLMDNPEIDTEKAKTEILKLAELKYECCTYDEGPQKTEYLKELISGREQLNIIDYDLLKSCVSRILIGHFYTVEIEFINGMTIKNITERTDKDDSDNAEC
ncbi:recombinase family protein [Porcipelethomonas sp.]|uniref:recombinase family protein n=1 Tax=Porcipelethomonas sp. TaxID=2981675 RepID=UPI00307761E1